MKIHKKICTIIVLILIGIVGLAGNVHANVQSVKNSNRGLTNTTASEFFSVIRKMESSGGPMGLNATISDAGVETGTNNIDTHMIKNTEWGAMVMLMDSEYGSRQSGAGDTTTSSSTGNVTGVYEIFSGYEYIAGMLDNNSSYNTNLHNTIQDGRSKYVNVYSSSSVEYKIGDATEETKKWLSASNADYPTSQYPVFRRGPTGAFSYRFYSGKGGADTSTRAVVVCGRRFLMKGEANDN